MIITYQFSRIAIPLKTIGGTLFLEKHPLKLVEWGDLVGEPFTHAQNPYPKNNVENQCRCVDLLRYGVRIE